MPEVELVAAAAGDVPVLRRFMPLDLYDLETIEGWELNPDGTDGNPERSERFWTEPGRRAFLIKVGCSTARPGPGKSRC